MQIQSACMPPVHIYLSKGMFLQSAFGPATTRSPDPPVWPRSGVMILPTGILIHQPPHILSQLYRPLLAATFRSRSFACFTFGRFTGTMVHVISVSIAARPSGRVRPPHMPNMREEPGTCYSHNYRCRRYRHCCSRLYSASLPNAMCSVLFACFDIGSDGLGVDDRGQRGQIEARSSGRQRVQPPPLPPPLSPPLPPRLMVT